MKNTVSVIYPVKDTVLSGKVLLFKSLYDWLSDAAMDAGITSVTPSGNGEPPYGEHIFFASAHYPFIDSELINKSFDAHISSEFKITAICSTEQDSVAAAWVCRSALEDKDLSAQNLDELLEALSSRDIKSGCFIEDQDTLLFPVHCTRDLHLANSAARIAVIDRAIDSGAVIMCSDGIIISPDAVIKEGATILPGSIIRGKSVIGERAVIGPNSVIDNSEIGAETVINASHITDSTVGTGTKIGPFTQLRPNSHIGNGVKIGDFVEIKNSTVGDCTSVAHLTYIGDSDVGRRVNFGCGTVTVNYDGKNKYRTQIDDFAFIGCNSNLIAPVKVGKNAYTAAGSTVTSDVPDDSLYICREKDERIIDGWVEKRIGKRRCEEE